MTQARQTQTGVELFIEDTPNAKVTQVGAELWALDTPTCRVTQVGIELWLSIPSYWPTALIMAS